MKPAIVVIPCWQRPGHLGALLESIRRARGWHQQIYMFSVDRGHDPEILDVIDSFPKSATKFVTLREHRFSGTVCNILSAYREAYDVARERGIGYVALLEEDLIVADDIFEFYADAFELAPPGCVGVSACRNQNTPDGRMPLLGTNRTRIDDAMRLRAIAVDVTEASAVYTHQSYQSIGSALDVKFLPKIIEHARPSYYVDQVGYCARELAADLPDAGASQDGLIHRIIRREGLSLMYTLAPRAFHAGWYGLNRVGEALDLPWRAAVPHILTMSADQMNARGDPRFQDIAPCNLIRDRVSLKLV